uniref:hypothetical protein n=1 Tax=Acetivibrio cellulolyticus TaxID=35830 RepID=UPI00031A8D67|nr:hypothetical protein [Acetivibrio cellulolyticus]
MKEVRDYAIPHWDSVIGGKTQTTEAKIIQDNLSKMKKEDIEIIINIIPKIVDTTLFYFLRMIEEDDGFDLVADAENGDKVSLREESWGLAGELYNEEGWIAKYSKERYEEIY